MALQKKKKNTFIYRALLNYFISRYHEQIRKKFNHIASSQIPHVIQYKHKNTFKCNIQCYFNVIFIYVAYQAAQFYGPDLGPKSLQRLSADDC